MYDYGGVMINCVATTVIFFLALICMEMGFIIIKRRIDPFNVSPFTITLD